MADDDKRKDDRLPVLWHGTLTTEDDQEFPCEVRDVSHAGTLITCDADVAMGQHLLLSIDNLGDFASVVKWQGSRGLGLMILAGPDLALKKFAEGAGQGLSESPKDPGEDPLAG